MDVALLKWNLQSLLISESDSLPWFITNGKPETARDVIHCHQRMESGAHRSVLFRAPDKRIHDLQATGYDPTLAHRW